MFKTIHDCNLELVAHSVGVATEEVDVDSRIITHYPHTSLDLMPCSAARVSFGNEDKTGKDIEKDIKLMRYLAEHQHMSPFEHQSATFLVEVPLFIRSQIMRHRTFSYNEISRRYTDENLEFWVPDSFRKQSASNRQASTDEKPFEHDACVSSYKLCCDYLLEAYEDLIASGVCREQARAVLPQSLLTKFYMTGNLRNWAHFVSLRKDAHAQKEVQVVANRIDEALRNLWPNAWGALHKEV